MELFAHAPLKALAIITMAECAIGSCCDIGSIAERDDKQREDGGSRTSGDSGVTRGTVRCGNHSGALCDGIALMCRGIK